MHRLARLLAAAALLGAPATTHAAPVAPARVAPAPEVVPGQVVVGFDADASRAARSRARDAVDATVADRVDADAQVLDVGRARDPEAVAARLARRPGVAFAAPNHVGHVAVGPRDPEYRPLAGVRLEDAWDYTTGSPAVRVGVADTGVAQHADLPPHAGTDPNGHGTEVAGVLAATGDNGIGIAGATWAADLRSFTACDAAGACTDAQVAKAIDDAAAAGVRVLTLAIATRAGSGPWPLTEQQLTAHAGDLLAVAAAGNGTVEAGGGRDVDVPGQAAYPCSSTAANLVCVAATRGDDALYRYTNWGPQSVDLAAPGVSVMTTVPGDAYAARTGTSLAAPLVAGVAGLLWARKPTATVAEVRAALEQVDPVPVLAGRTATGGRLDALKALAAIDPGPAAQVDGAQVTGDDATFAFSAAEPHSTFECRLVGPAWTPCASPATFRGVPPGDLLLRVRATDAAGRGGGALGERSVDRTPPALRITTPPRDARDGDARVAFDAGDATAVECRVDDGAWVPACTSPQAMTVDAAAEAEHHVDVRATDASGNAVTATRTWRVDRTPPPHAEIEVDGDEVRFGVPGEPGATFACSMGSEGPVPCTSPLTFAGGPLMQVVTVVPTDAAGNQGPAFARTWPGGDPGPAVAVASRPAPVTRDEDARVDVLAEQPATCAFDGGAPAACGPAWTATDLDPGPHTLVVAAGTTSQTVRWTVDRSAPDALVAAAPDDPAAARPTLAWAVEDAAPATPECTLDGGPVACGASTCPPAQPGCGTGAFTPAADLGEGRHTFTLVPLDAAGNRGDEVTATWVRDTVDPVVGDLARIAGGGQVPDKPRFTWSLSEDATTTCALDGGAPVACRSGWGTDGVDAGEHELVVTATDAAGNAAQEPLDFTVVHDATTVAAAPPATTTATAVDARFAFPRGASRYEVRLDGGPWTTTRTGAVHVEGLGAGPHVLTGRAVAPEPGTPATTAFTVLPTPADPAPVTPRPTATPTPAPSPAPTSTPAPQLRPASTQPLTRSVARRLRGTGPQVARRKPFSLTYRATLPGRLLVRVELRTGRRWTAVGGGSVRYGAAGARRVRITISPAGRKHLRRAGRTPKLRVRAIFTPARTPLPASG